MADPADASRADPRLAVSVVVCTRNRARFLDGVLESLGRQTAAPDSYEVLIVDNGSTDGTAGICSRFIDAHPERRFRHVVESRTGLSQARNRGLSDARGDVLTFIDDDAVAMPDFVAAVTAFFAAYGDADAVGGRVLAVFDGDRPRWWNRFSASLFFSHYDRGDRSFRYTRWNGYPIGCNMSFRAHVLREAGGFDPVLGRQGTDALGGEEKAVFARLIVGGHSCWYDPAQVVHHRIPQARTEVPYLRSQALGLGRTHRAMYCRNDVGLSCAWPLAITLAKLVFTVGLAAGYAFRGQPHVGRHLVWYRWLVLQGYLRGSRTAP